MVKVTTVKTVKLTDVREAAGDQGRAVWEEVMMRVHGNQKFNNDSWFLYWVPSLNGDPNSPIQDLIVELCGEAMVDHEVLFEVSW